MKAEHVKTRTALLFVSACRESDCGPSAAAGLRPKAEPFRTSCCSHKKPGLETGKPKLAATRYCPVKKARRGRATAVCVALLKRGQVYRMLEASTKVWRQVEKVKRKKQRSRKQPDPLEICPRCGNVTAKRRPRRPIVTGSPHRRSSHPPMWLHSREMPDSADHIQSLRTNRLSGVF